MINGASMCSEAEFAFGGTFFDILAELLRFLSDFNVILERKVATIRQPMAPMGRRRLENLIGTLYALNPSILHSFNLLIIIKN